jgi:hypothetical protein
MPPRWRRRRAAWEELVYVESIHLKPVLFLYAGHRHSPRYMVAGLGEPRQRRANHQMSYGSSPFKIRSKRHSNTHSLTQNFRFSTTRSRSLCHAWGIAASRSAI